MFGEGIMLRVIGGTHRSRKIKEVPTSKTRPTTDKNKETVFNILGQYFSHGRVLDLFAGSGALGIEAISRGMDEAVFVDNQIPAQKTIAENLESLGFAERGKIMRVDVFEFLKTKPSTFNLIFADPPYALDKYQELLEAIVYGHFIACDGIIVFEADSKTNLPDKCENFHIYREKISGNTKFGFYRMEESL